MLKYELDQIKFSELKEKIEIPKFQRGLVWGEGKKKEFIKSLKAGLPIGVLLLSKTNDNKYLVIDGLQRFSTMMDYSKDYFKYIDSSEISDGDALSVIYASKEATDHYSKFDEKNQHRLVDAVRKIIVSNISAGYNLNLNQISQSAAQQMCKDIEQDNTASTAVTSARRLS